MKINKQKLKNGLVVLLALVLLVCACFTFFGALTQKAKAVEVQTKEDFENQISFVSNGIYDNIHIHIN